jgi:ATP-dependent Lon protease
MRQSDAFRRRAVMAPDTLPVLPLFELVVYPTNVAPLSVGPEPSVKLVHEAMAGDRLVALVTQRNANAPARPEDLHRIGTMASIHQIVNVDGHLRAVVQGIERIRLVEFLQSDPYPVARFESAPERVVESLELEALSLSVKELFIEVVALHPALPEQLASAIESISDPLQMAYLVASTVPIPTLARQEILELDGLDAKLRRLSELLRHEIEVRKLVARVAGDTGAEISREQQRLILREHMRTIQRELGEGDPEEEEGRELRERIEALALPEEAKKEVERELERLERTPIGSPEHGVIRTFLDWVVKLPWGKTTGAPIDLDRARDVLDEDHYGLDKVKDRIVEYLAVKKLRTDRGVEVPTGDAVAAPRHEPILCFVGPPGVGKTSIGQSIARAMERRFVRLSLGGIHDEAEIRGHRRTYIGAMPGRILQALARGESGDPVFMLDEVDKLGVGFHGDPSAALLEVLDPAQNHAFVDTYLGMPFDLSSVLFICTANTVDTIPPPLLDRMEVLAIPGYTDTEKLQIAERYLVPKLEAAHGLRPREVEIDRDLVRCVIRQYTREAGVRNLERELATILRKIARKIARDGNQPPIHLARHQVHAYLGPQRFFDEVAERIDRPGVATGLAWTPAGGDVLFVEATMMHGREERLILTGMLGDVMRESAQAALSFLRANPSRLGVDPEILDREVVHVHVPAGAIPKDGPSAGVTILAALASFASGRPLRTDTAMTGEITLRGKVLPVGGIKEKVLAAHRVGLRRVILPRRNEGALEDVPEEVRRALEPVFVESIEEVVAAAFEPVEEDVRAGTSAVH